MKKTILYVLVFGSTLFIYPLFYANAEDANRLVVLSKRIIETKSEGCLCDDFEELKDIYFKENKYSEFVVLLKSLSEKNKTIEQCVNYYIALTRYSQLKYLEEKQIWDEYFNQGNTYRDEISTRLESVVNTTSAKCALKPYARLILWQFHRDQQDVLHEQALLDLMNSTIEYAKDSQDTLPIRTVADKLSSYGEKGKAKELYKIYKEKILASDITEEELRKNALDFYKEGNLELSQSLYDAYIERISKSAAKEKVIPALIDIAKAFAYKDRGRYDMLYAEKIFQKIEELGGKEIFDEELLYLRAYNLEKAKEYARAKDIYLDLLKLSPQGAHADEAEYKIGIICVYILRDVKNGKGYFEKLAQKEITTPQAISSLYQLGLLHQWENEFAGAKEYYNKLLLDAKENFPETVALVKARIKEIDESKPLDYNLQAFLGSALKDENANIDMTKSNLGASLYGPKKDEETNITSGMLNLRNGCMQVELQYFWSGDLGNTKIPSEQLPSSPAFITTYGDPGTKVINLLIVSPTGIMERGLEMIDVR
jgi:TolA-binding protein